jgi:hypothetical protein
LKYIPDVIASWICLLAKADRTVGVKELLEKGATRQPEPHASIDAPIRIEQLLLKYLKKKKNSPFTHQ